MNNLKHIFFASMLMACLLYTSLRSWLLGRRRVSMLVSSLLSTTSSVTKMCIRDRIFSYICTV